MILFGQKKQKDSGGTKNVSELFCPNRSALPWLSWSGLAAAVLLFGTMPLSAAEWHAAPNGTSQGDGTRSQPWDLKTALNHPAAVKPGDTIWLHEGTYRGHFQGNLKGTEQAPIIVRQSPGERAIIDGNFNLLVTKSADVFEVAGAYTWYWGFEITSSHANRRYDKAEFVLTTVVK